MSSVVPSGYKFGATYVGNKQFSPTEVRINVLFKDKKKKFINMSLYI